MPIAITIERPKWGVNYGPGFNCFTVRRGDFVASGIQWFTRWDDINNVPVSHTFPVIGPDLTIEAFGNGVKLGTLSAYLDDPNVALLVRKPVGWTPEMGARMVAEAKKHVGRGYDWPLIGTMMMSRTFVGRGINQLTKGWFGQTLNRFVEGKEREICSELMASVDQAQPELAGRDILSLPAYDIDPVSLFSSHIFEPGAVELVREPSRSNPPFS